MASRKQRPSPASMRTKEAVIVGGFDRNQQLREQRRKPRGLVRCRDAGANNRDVSTTGKSGILFGSSSTPLKFCQASNRTSPSQPRATSATASSLWQVPQSSRINLNRAASPAELLDQRLSEPAGPLCAQLVHLAGPYTSLQ